MSIKLFQGKEFRTRGSNKKYPQLDNLDELFELLKKHSRDEAAQILCVPYNSINYLIRRYFPDEWLKQIKIKRHRKVG